MAAFLPILLFVLIAAALAVGMIAAPRLLAPRKLTAVKEMPYESGMDPIHDTRRRFAVRFHLVAIAFLVFDVELLFLYPWAVATRQNAMGNGEWRMGNEQAGTERAKLAVSDSSLPIPHSPFPTQARGIDQAVADQWVSSRGLVFAGAMVFVLLVVLGFAYDWRKGIFQWR